uniref:Putative extracellular protein tem7 n=1 Tax=Corethrella appendiculata TaxID=1370023 RepID=U5ERP6_9DIPT
MFGKEVNNLFYFLIIILTVNYYAINAEKENYVRLKRQINQSELTTKPPIDVENNKQQKPVSLSENKTSQSKQKLANDSLLNGKKNIEQQQLLGVNGTGQRKEYLSSTIPSTIVSEPITPKLVLTSSKNDWSNSTFEEEIIDSVDKETNESEFNKTLSTHNLTKYDDFHLYYNSSVFVHEEESRIYWKRLENLNISHLLSNSHRRATTVLLSFDFPFYGHSIRNITIATGGFLYTGDYVHSWLASTQYIAPLMANFDTSLSNSSYVKFKDDGNTFDVVWENVSLQDRRDVAPFTFAASLNKSGDIIFAYKNVPIDIELIQSDKHPVKVGLSDAYIIDKTIVRTKQKTIYEYHRVNFNNNHILNSTMITLTALPTCGTLKDCQTCLAGTIPFKCTWCPTLNRCSTGIDRKRQDWMQKGCDKTQIIDKGICPALGQKGNNPGIDETQHPDAYDNYNATFNKHDEYQPNSGTKIKSLPDDHINKVKLQSSDANDAKSNKSLVVTIVVVLTILLGCSFWVLYAYRHPHTKSGQLLIRYRPNNWSWRRGEARYTAATIHM